MSPLHRRPGESTRLVVVAVIAVTIFYLLFMLLAEWIADRIAL
jgi:hypothetical protein